MAQTTPKSTPTTPSTVVAAKAAFDTLQAKEFSKLVVDCSAGDAKITLPEVKKLAGKFDGVNYTIALTPEAFKKLENVDASGFNIDNATRTITCGPGFANAHLGTLDLIYTAEGFVNQKVNNTNTQKIVTTNTMNATFEHQESNKQLSVELLPSSNIVVSSDQPTSLVMKGTNALASMIIDGGLPQ